jgi:hypothetical protein
VAWLAPATAVTGEGAAGTGQVESAPAAGDEAIAVGGWPAGGCVVDVVDVVDVVTTAAVVVVEGGASFVVVVVVVAGTVVVVLAARAVDVVLVVTCAAVLVVVEAFDGPAWASATPCADRKDRRLSPMATRFLSRSRALLERDADDLASPPGSTLRTPAASRTHHWTPDSDAP